MGSKACAQNREAGRRGGQRTSQLLEGGLRVPFLDFFSDLKRMTGGRLRYTLKRRERLQRDFSGIEVFYAGGIKLSCFGDSVSIRCWSHGIVFLPCLFWEWEEGRVNSQLRLEAHVTISSHQSSRPIWFQSRPSLALAPRPSSQQPLLWQVHNMTAGRCTARQLQPPGITRSLGSRTQKPKCVRREKVWGTYVPAHVAFPPESTFFTE